MPDPTPPTALIDPDRLRHLMKNESRTWGKLVRARRDALGFTLDQVARLSGTTPQTLHKIEKGQIAPRDAVRIAIACALGTDVHSLFPMPDRAFVMREAAS